VKRGGGKVVDCPSARYSARLCRLRTITGQELAIVELHYMTCKGSGFFLIMQKGRAKKNVQFWRCSSKNLPIFAGEKDRSKSREASFGKKY
jgi:hypothetical protein